MPLLIVQLSDIHFGPSAQDNPLLSRCGALVGAIRSELTRGDDCLVVLSGDIANKGKKAEYDVALGFMQQLIYPLSEHIGHPVNIAVIPGNHDHDFGSPGYDQRIRESVINASSPLNPPNEAMHELLLLTQAPFRDFCEQAGSRFNALSVTNLSAVHTLITTTSSINLLLLNSTRFTQVVDKHGTSWFPIDALSDSLSKLAPEGISIAVSHHPYNWFQEENSLALKLLLEGSSDLLLTGHEHRPDQYVKSRKSTEQNLYVEGGVLQDPESNDRSSFNVVRLDIESKTLSCKTYAWSGEIYEAITEESTHRFLRLRQSVRSSFELTPSMRGWLEQVGTDFRHPRARDLRLNDLFVYPDLRKLDVSRSLRPTGFVHDRDVLGFIQEKKRILITGNEKIGKTSLCKSLFVDLQEAGILPVILRNEFLGKTSKHLPLDERLRQLVHQVVEHAYAASSSTRFWQTPISNRAILIDDLDRLSLPPDARNQLLAWCTENFGITVVTAEPGIRMRDILNRSQTDTILWTFDHAEIMESDRETRDSLIAKWLLAGTDPLEVSSEALYASRVRFAQVIDSLIGQGALPSIPLFVQMMLQQLETRGAVDTSAGLYGALYERLIRDVIVSSSESFADIEVKLNYLSEFAYALFLISQRHLDRDAFCKWHKEYCEMYNLSLNEQDVSEQLRDMGVFRRDPDAFGFKYRYYFCFFLARYLSQHIHEEEVIRNVEQLAKLLYNIDAANTMLFLCHLCKHPRILELVLETAEQHFQGVAKYDLSLTPDVVPDHRIAPSLLALPCSPLLEEERAASLRNQDDFNPPSGLEEVGDDSRSSVKQSDAIISLINETNSAHHVVRICGQILRNFYGSMKGESQVRLIRATYAVALRMFTVIYEFLERDRENIAASLAQLIRHQCPTLPDSAVDDQARNYLQSLAMRVCYGLIKHTSTSIGLTDVRASFDKILSSPDVTVSEKLLDASTRLDYFDDFPRREVQDIAQAFQGKGIGYEALRILSWEHFKQFRVPYDVRQSICSTLDIRIDQAIFLNPKDKKR